MVGNKLLSAEIQLGTSNQSWRSFWE